MRHHHLQVFFENNVSYLDFDIEISYEYLYEKYLIKTVVNVIIERKTIAKSTFKSICTKRYNACLKNYPFNAYGNSVTIDKIKQKNFPKGEIKNKQ